MSLRNEFLRHQILLTRLVNTQARNTKKILLDVSKYIIGALEENYVNPKTVFDLLNELPSKAMELLYSLGQYESEFTVKKIAKFRKIKLNVLTNEKVTQIVDSITVPTTLYKDGKRIKENYTIFADTKAHQYMQIIKDSNTLKEDKEITIKKIKEITGGLFTVQNKSLAQISIIAVANQVRRATLFNVS